MVIATPIFLKYLWIEKEFLGNWLTMVEKSSTFYTVTIKDSKLSLIQSSGDTKDL